MAKRLKPTEIVAKLRQADVPTFQGRSWRPSAPWRRGLPSLPRVAIVRS